MADLDNADELYHTLNVICDGEPAADVIYAIARLIAHGVAKQCTDKNPETTFQLLREAVDVELMRYRPQPVPTI